MSRIGKKPIEIPSGVEVKIENNVVTVKGPKGTESVAYRDEVKVSVVENNIVVEPNSNDRKTGALHGLFRTLIANAVEGVSKGFEKKLEIVGVGYRANMPIFLLALLMAVISAWARVFLSVLRRL